MIGLSSPEPVDGDWVLKTPCAVELIGPSGAGKSTLLLKLLEDDSVWDEKLSYVVYCAPCLEDRQSYLTQFANIAKKVGKAVCFLDKLPTPQELKTFSQGNPVLLMLDDMPLFQDLTGLNELIAMHSRHQGISALFCLQNPFLKKKGVDMTLFSRNLSGRFVMYQRSDYYLFSILNTRLFPDRKHFLIDCLTHAKDKVGRAYVFINTHCHAGLPRRFMLYTSLFSDERVNGSPIFYDLEHK